MDIEWLRKLCLSFPGCTEQIQWGDNLLFKVGGKMFAVAALEPSSVWLSFKTSPENFVELVELPGIVPAPYLARAKWVALKTREAVAPEELARLLQNAYELIFAKLSGKAQIAISERVRRKRKTGRKHSAKAKKGRGP